MQEITVEKDAGISYIFFVENQEENLCKTKSTSYKPTNQW